MKLKSVDYKEKWEDGIVYTVDAYEIGDYYVRKFHKYNVGDGWAYTSYSVYAKDHSKEYLPEIYYEDDILGDKKAYFSVQTTAYGALKTDEIDKVIAGYQQAKEVADTLTKLFC